MTLVGLKSCGKKRGDCVGFIQKKSGLHNIKKHDLRIVSLYSDIFNKITKSRSILKSTGTVEQNVQPVEWEPFLG